MIFLTVKNSQDRQKEEELMNEKLSEILLKIDSLDTLSFNSRTVFEDISLDWNSPLFNRLIVFVSLVSDI